MHLQDPSTSDVPFSCSPTTSFSTWSFQRFSRPSSFSFVPSTWWIYTNKGNHGPGDPWGDRCYGPVFRAAWCQWKTVATIWRSLPEGSGCPTSCCIRHSAAVDSIARAMDVPGNTKVHAGCGSCSGSRCIGTSSQRPWPFLHASWCWSPCVSTHISGSKTKWSW